MSTLLKLGYTNPLTDAFGAHPQLGSVLDLNDGATFTLTYPDGLELPPPPRTLVTAGNIRTQGEKATRAIYRHNREVRAGLILGPMSNYASLTAAIRLLLSWLNSPPSIPFTIQYQAPGAASPVYLDVVGAAHTIPEDEGDWLRLQLEPIEILFVCRPGLRGDRLWLQNLVVNPGFEAPSGPAVQVFNDSFANANAYTTLGGAAPTVAANVLTLPSGSLVSFGSPAWGSINQWALRFQMPAGSAFLAYLHYVDANNSLRVNVQPTIIALEHTVASSKVSIASAPITTTGGTFYWLVVTQFPTVPGDPAYVTAALFADSGGSRGALVSGSSIAGATQEIGSIGSTVALSGVMALQNTSGGSIGIGGAFPNVHTVSLFGPGGWLFLGMGGGSGAAAGAWEGSGIGVASQGQSISNTLPLANGPVQSYGAARIDAAPAGTLDAQWLTYNGGAPAGTSAIPATQGQQVGVLAWVKAPGLGASATLRLLVAEWTAAGGFVSNTAVVTFTGPQANWTQLTGAYTVQNATTAFIGLALRATDSTMGSAGATIWWENVQVWQTSKGASMPYCELRFLQSPARLIVSGLLGDLPAPAFFALGTYLASWPTGSLLNVAVGRRGQLSATDRLVAPSNGYYGTALSPTGIAVLDAASFGGYYVQASVAAGGWNPRAFSFAPADAPGIYHLFARFLTQQLLANLGNVQVRLGTQQRSQNWYGQPNQSDTLGNVFGPYTSPMVASSAWQVVDAGQLNVPALPAGALSDPAQTILTPRQSWVDNTGGGSTCQIGWQALIPIDGSLLVAVINNPSNAPFALTQQWLWAYFDGLGVPTNQPVAWTTSAESAPTPNPAHAGGGPGTTSSGAINVNSEGDPYLTLDPTLDLAANSPTSGGVNELVAYVADQSAAVLAFFGEIVYSPTYLYPR